ncbi:MAG: YesL family protein [Oscillospiraceae bacterium]|nr:YesL family protein [Oscillospiraceae bacterium]
MANLFSFIHSPPPGKGIDKTTKKKRKIFSYTEIYFQKFWKLLQLNFIFILFSIPIVTIGPALSATSYIMKNFVTHNSVFLFHDFLQSFKQNFKKSFVISIFSLVIHLLLYISLSFYGQNMQSNKIIIIPYLFILLSSIIFIFMNYYIHIMIISVDLKIITIIKNSFLLAFLCIKSNIFISILIGIIIYIHLLIAPFSIFLFFIIGFITIQYIINCNAYFHIEKYIIKKD